MSGPPLSARALGRATLARQLLLGRDDRSVPDAVAHLLGLNAQEPDLPYLALWSRLERVTITDVTRAIEDGTLVRSTLMRSTQHVMTAEDFTLVRPALAGLLRRVQRNTFGSRTRGIDLGELVRDARELLADGTVLTRPELGRRLAASRPGADPTALGWTVQYLLPVTHPAPSGTWRTRGATPFALPRGALPAEATADDVATLLRRYLAAFGPATVSDMRVWSGISGLREVVAGMRPDLRVLRDERGRELLDLPEAPLPDPDTPAPVRLLPAFDAFLLGHHDRTRVMSDDVRRQVCVGSGVAATVLVDGTVAATWDLVVGDGAATLTVSPFRRLSAAERDEVEAEAHRLLAFTDPGAEHDVRVVG
ncbi:winged helix DNA-binding domain-containing protein [Georgenia alba]|uniref:Winged helix DNA-binding domain-containing protein n=1 Tax=Georgenia alba TaxID=2233858 RepID=A0ABW2Q5Q6_9MICO